MIEIKEEVQINTIPMGVQTTGTLLGKRKREDVVDDVCLRSLERTKFIEGVANKIKRLQVDDNVSSKSSTSMPPTPN